MQNVFQYLESFRRSFRTRDV